MATPLYDIHFTADRAAPSVLPRKPQPAGTYGDDGFAQVTFTLVNADEAAGHSFRIEIVDGGGAYDLTELLTAADNAITYGVPTSWTTAGIATLRLVEVVIDGDGVQTDVLHYPPVYLSFADRDDGDPMGEMLPAWQGVMTKAEHLLPKMEEISSVGIYTIGSGLKLDNKTKTLSVDVAHAAEMDNTRPITSAAVHTEIGNINTLLHTI